MKRWFKRMSIAAVVALVMFILSVERPSGARDIEPPKDTPNFTQHDADLWINSPPLSLQDVRGKVVLIDFWTFDCWNCYRSFPWLIALESRYQGLQVIGIHTPEFKHEKVKSNVEKKVREFGLKHPVMMDNDYRYWQAMGNRYWPSFYLLDKRGRTRAYFVGETHEGDRRAKQVEAVIQKLLLEPDGV
jgi:thiol-disulfide isomerase/thioredoxin